jgi:DNA-binding transcriptional ArsR family regulator
MEGVLRRPPALPDCHARDLAEVDVITVLGALSDPVRLEIVRQLDACGATGEMTCDQIEIPASKSTGMHHLKVVYRAGITGERQQGTRKYLSLRRTEPAEGPRPR